MTRRVTVIGDALLDVHVTPGEPMRPGADVPATVSVGPGGQGANVAVRLARRGVDVELLCALGRDAAATIVRAALEADGVHLRELPVDATGTVVILGDAAGERTMLSQRASFATVAAAAGVGDASWIVVSGYLLLEPGFGRLAKAVGHGAARRVLVGCAVPDPMTEAWREAARMVDPDLLVMNRDELERLAIGSPGAGVAVTHAGGASVTIDTTSIAVDTPSGPPAVDTTGAGDAFAAGMVSSLLHIGWPPSAEQLEAAARDAVTLAAAVARVPGAQARVDGERAGTLAR